MKPATLIAALIAGSTIAFTPALAAAEPGTTAQPASASIDATHAAKLKAVKAKAIAYLRSKQDSASGAWGVNAKGGPTYPAMTGLVLGGMLMEPGIDASDESVKAGLKYMLGKQQPDGGIYDKVLPSYNTAICLSALAKLRSPDTETAKAIVKAQVFLKSLQYSEAATVITGLDESPKPVDKSNAYYGGWGYGRSGRPDMSNSQWALEALHDSGVAADDQCFQRAMVFLQRCQMVDSINDMSYADGSKQGGFIYSTSESKDKVGGGQSQAATTIEETMDDGTKVSKLRAYGSMTYAGFKSYLYAGLKKDDARVQQATRWISENYTLDENPGMGTDGFYYYIHTFSRALSTLGEPTVKAKTKAPAGGEAVDRNWRHDLIDKLAELQQEDGSFKPFKDRWLENDPVLITAYSLLALEHAAK